MICNWIEWKLWYVAMDDSEISINKKMIKMPYFINKKMIIIPSTGSSVVNS
jgi:hypothetical protein